MPRFIKNWMVDPPNGGVLMIKLRCYGVMFLWLFCGCFGRKGTLGFFSDKYSSFDYFYDLVQFLASGL